MHNYEILLPFSFQGDLFSERWANVRSSVATHELQPCTAPVTQRTSQPAAKIRCKAGPQGVRVAISNAISQETKVFLNSSYVTKK